MYRCAIKERLKKVSICNRICTCKSPVPHGDELSNHTEAFIAATRNEWVPVYILPACLTAWGQMPMSLLEKSTTAFPGIELSTPIKSQLVSGMSTNKNRANTSSFITK